MSPVRKVQGKHNHGSERQRDGPEREHHDGANHGCVSPDTSDFAAKPRGAAGSSAAE